MIAEIDEQELERLLQIAAEAVDVPEDGPADVLRAARTQLPRRVNDPIHVRQDRRFWVRSFAAAATIVIVVGVAVAALGHGKSSESAKSSAGGGTAAPTAPPKFQASNGALGGGVAPRAGLPADSAYSTHLSANSPRSLQKDARVDKGTAAGVNREFSTSPTTTATGTGGSAAADSARIVATGETVMEVGKGAVGKTADAVTAVAKGAGGYVADSSTTGGDSPTASVTIRVPQPTFDDTVARVSHLAATFHGKVDSSTTHAADVTAQYTDLQAKRDAAAHERDQLFLVEQRAQTIGDILAVRDRINAVQTEIDQLIGQIRLLNDQSTYSSLAVSISEKGSPPKPVAHAHVNKPLSGLTKARHDAAAGFAKAVEWIISRSGGMLVALAAIIALMFLLRYLYPVIRRGLL